MSDETPSWIESLPEEKRAAAIELLAQFKSLGATDAEDWAQSEIEEDFAQLARFLFLRRILLSFVNFWRDHPEIWTDPFKKGSKAAIALKKMQDAGISAEEIGAVARMVAYQTATNMVFMIDAGKDRWETKELPGWKLMETNQNGELTGRDVAALHEDMLIMAEKLTGLPLSK
jgi:hypothetical protein